MNAGLFAAAPGRYDRWYEWHPALYRAELATLKRAGGDFTNGLEVGVGTGRFASALGLSWGIDPVREMLEIARGRGCRVLRAAAEVLPFPDATFRRVLMVTVLCFVHDPKKAVAEACRVLQPGGRLLLGIIDPESLLGRAARSRKDPDSFYADARFLSVSEVLDLLPTAVRGEVEIFQSVFPGEAEGKHPPKVEKGYGRGAFVVISAAQREPN